MFIISILLCKRILYRILLFLLPATKSAQDIKISWNVYAIHIRQYVYKYNALYKNYAYNNAYNAIQINNRNAVSRAGNIVKFSFAVTRKKIIMLMVQVICVQPNGKFVNFKLLI